MANNRKTTNGRKKQVIYSEPRTIEDGLKLDDIVIKDNKYERLVLAIVDNIIILSEFDDFYNASNSYTLLELIGYKYALKQPEETKFDELVHLTFKDIKDGKGKGIDPKLIRIKQ
jgi:transposase